MDYKARALSITSRGGKEGGRARETDRQGEGGRERGGWGWEGWGRERESSENRSPRERTAGHRGGGMGRGMRDRHSGTGEDNKTAGQFKAM